MRLHTVPGTGTPHIQAYQPSARVIRPTYKGRGLDSKTRQGPPLFYNTTEPSHYREVGTFHPQGIRNHTPQGDSSPNGKSQTVNLNQKSINGKTLNPKPETRIPKPQTPNPKS